MVAMFPLPATISVTKEGVKFSVTGEMGSGNMTIRQQNSVDTKDDEQVSCKTDIVRTICKHTIF